MQQLATYNPRNKLIFIFILVLAVLLPFSFQQMKVHAASSDVIVKDIFDRTLNDAQITLVDWEGHIANPLIELKFEAPQDAVFPAKMTISANGVRLYFAGDYGQTNATIGTSGPSAEFFVNSASEMKSLGLSIFPDRAGGDEDYTLTVLLEDTFGQTQSTITVPIHVVDHDYDRPLEFNIHLDYSQDKSGFFTTAADASKAKEVGSIAAYDWAYFIADMNLDPVPAGSETNWIWNYPSGYQGNNPTQYPIQNSSTYTGFLVYIYGKTCPVPSECAADKLISGGRSSTSSWQTTGGVRIGQGLRRSGDVIMETQGDYDQKGWLISTSDDDWYLAANGNSEVNDLYSIMRHEIGHAFGYFSFAYPAFQSTLNSPNLQSYYGGGVTPNNSDHLDGYIDPASQYGVFGNEYGGKTPIRRWIITKLDLYILEAIGYQLRDTTALAALNIATTTLPNGNPQQAYSASLQGSGGIPFYKWSLKSGSLPDGLSMDSFTGQISGTPTTEGQSKFTVELCDYDRKTACISKEVTLNIGFVAGAAPNAPYNLSVNPNQGRPTLKFKTDQNAEWYNIWIGGANGQVHYEWYPADPSKAFVENQAAIACEGLTCTLKPNINPTGGSYAVWMQSWGTGGFSVGGNTDYDGWSTVEFSLPTTAPGPASNLVAAVTPTGSSKVAFTWHGAERATWYNVWVGTDGTGTPPWTPQFFDWMLAEDLGCENALTCTLATGTNVFGGTANLELPSGEYIWYIQSWGPGGFSTGGSFDPPLDAWVEASKFTVP